MAKSAPAHFRMLAAGDTEVALGNLQDFCWQDNRMQPGNSDDSHCLLLPLRLHDIVVVIAAQTI